MITLANDANFKELINAHDKVVVKFYAGWCGNCRLFAPKFKAMSDKEEYAGIAFLDVNAEESPETRKMAGVNNLPFFATFQNGELVKGDFTSKPEVVEQMIRNIL